MKLANIIRHELNEDLLKLGFEIISSEECGFDRKACHTIEIIEMSSKNYSLRLKYSDGGISGQIGNHNSKLQHIRTLAQPELLTMTLDELFKVLPNSPHSIKEQCEELIGLIPDAIKTLKS